MDSVKPQLPEVRQVIDAVVYVAASVDGYIARADGSLDWLPNADPDQGEDYGWSDLMASIDAVVMGRETFEVARDYPGSPYGDASVFVLTTRDLGPMPGWDVEVLNGDVHEVAAAMEQRGLQTIYVDGGTVIQSFLRAGLVRRITVTQLPILLGGGIRLFGGHETDIHLRLVSSTAYDNGWLQVTYDVTPG